MKLTFYASLRAIGWSVTNNGNIIDAGIKRLNISFDNYYEYIAGQPVTKRINKRLKKSARKNKWRYRSRRAALAKFLIKQGFPEHLTDVPDNNILRIRVKGLSEKLSKNDLAHALFSLQKKRGYKSLRGVSDNDASEYLQQIEMHENELKKHPSAAAYLLTLASRRNVILRRETYEAEFRAIMEKQQLAPEVEEQLFKIIYYQRPLKKPPVSSCKMERNKKVIHASNPHYQAFRCWRDANNIILFDAHGDEIEIPFHLRSKWQALLYSGANITKARCLKDLGIKKNAAIYRWVSGKQLVGYQFKKELNAIRFSGNDFELWQDMFSATDDERLRFILKNKYQLDEYQSDYLIDLNLNTFGYADYSRKAIEKLTQHLAGGMKLSEALLHVYGKVEFEETSLRNVLLEQVHESTNSLVAAIKKQYQITEACFEIDTLLKIGNKGRKELSKNKRKNEKWLKENEAILAGRSSYDVLKYQLWQQQEGVCVYTGKEITLEDVFSKKTNIDHIVPKSKIFERGPVNEVLTFVKNNEEKARTTGFEYAESIGDVESYVERVNKLPSGKQKFLMMRETEIPDNYLSGNLDYNTKCFAAISKGATHIPNKLLNRYYREWHFAKYDDGDARQVLAKAMCMANFNAETVAYFDNIREATAKQTSVSAYDLTPDISAKTAMPVIDAASVFMPRKKYTKKTMFGYCPRAPLHAESMFGIRYQETRNTKGEIVKHAYFKVRQPVSKLTPNMVNNIMAGNIKQLITQRIAQHSSHEAALESMVSEPPTFNNKPIKAVSVRVESESFIPLRSSDGKGKIGKKNAYEIPVHYVQASSYYSTEINFANGKLQRQNIRLIDFCDAKNKAQKIEQRTLSLHHNTQVIFEDKEYFVLGPGDSMMIRPVYQLEAKDQYRLKVSDYAKLEVVKRNQLGKIVGDGNK